MLLWTAETSQVEAMVVLYGIDYVHIMVPMLGAGKECVARGEVQKIQIGLSAILGFRF